MAEQGIKDLAEDLQERTDPQDTDRFLMINAVTKKLQYVLRGALGGGGGEKGDKGEQGPRGFKGDNGEDGREVELRNSGTHIQWRYVGTATWTNLISLAELKGDKGDKGDTGNAGNDGQNGREIELGASATHIRWRYAGDSTWTNLIALTELKGDKGDKGDPGEKGDTGEQGVQGPKGADGTSVRILDEKATVADLPTTATFGDGYIVGMNLYVWNGVQWINAGEIKGPKGDPGADGTNGQDGADGRSVELRKGDTHLQWRLVGDAEWIDIISLEELKGEKGDAGGITEQEVKTILEESGIQTGRRIISLDIKLSSPTSGTMSAVWVNDQGQEYSVTDFALVFDGAPSAGTFRWDLIELLADGNVNIKTGTEATEAIKPTPTAGGIVAGEVLWNEAGEVEEYEEQPASGNVPNLQQVTQRGNRTNRPIEHAPAQNDKQSATLGQVKDLIPDTTTDPYAMEFRTAFPVAWDKPAIYGSKANPLTGAITESNTDAKVITQIIFYQNSSFNPPTSWQEDDGSAEFDPSKVSVIYIEHISNTYKRYTINYDK